MPKGIKICPECETHCGPRSFNCKGCGYEFRKKIDNLEVVAKPITPKTGRGRGYKVCPSCQNTCGPRTIICPHCEHEFDIKRKLTQKGISVNWRNLLPGKHIKVKSGGAYYIPKSGKFEGQRISMGYRGIFQVYRLERDGILTYAKKAKKNDGGFCFIYMGETKESPYGHTQQAHNIVEVKPRERKDNANNKK